MVDVPSLCPELVPRARVSLGPASTPPECVVHTPQENTRANACAWLTDTVLIGDGVWGWCGVWSWGYCIVYEWRVEYMDSAGVRRVHGALVCLRGAVEGCIL